MLYFDNAATSFPKPPVVAAAVGRFLSDQSGQIGRSGHSGSQSTGEMVYLCRERIARLFNAADPLRVCFSLNATSAINMLLFGMLNSGDQVVTTSIEHNAVLRPLYQLQKQGVELKIVAADQTGQVDAQKMIDAVTDKTRLVLLNHASNVTGAISPLAEIAAWLTNRRPQLLVDCSQSGGSLPIDMQADKIDMIAFTGHKGLLGPTGVGGFILGEQVDELSLRPTLFGGTGSASASPDQPDFLPDRFESGTLNSTAICGLSAAVDWLLERGTDTVREQKIAKIEKLLAALTALESVTLHCQTDAAKNIGVVSFNIDNLAAAKAAAIFDKRYRLQCRSGLHCAPLTHKTIGTFPAGAIRFSIGIFNSYRQIEQAAAAVSQTVKEINS